MKGKKTGGREKGTPNKTTAVSRQLIQDIVSPYFNSEQFMLDVGKLDPKERIDAMTKLAAFLVPKPQSIAVDLHNTKKTTIEDRLKALSEEQENYE